MEIPAWSGVGAAILSFLGGIFGDFLRRAIPTYTDLAAENRELRRELSELREVIHGLEDTIRDASPKAEE